MSAQNARSDALPERLILTLDRGYILLLLLFALGFVALGAFLVDYQRGFWDWFWGWASILFFGLCAIAGVLDLIAPRLSYMALTPDGFRYAYLLRRDPATTPWSEIAAIEIYRWYAGGWPRNGVRIVSTQPSRRATTLVTPRMFGYDAQSLAALLNRFRDRALQSETALKTAG